MTSVFYKEAGRQAGPSMTYDVRAKKKIAHALLKNRRGCRGAVHQNYFSGKMRARGNRKRHNTPKHARRRFRHLDCSQKQLCSLPTDRDCSIHTVTRHSNTPNTFGASVTKPALAGKELPEQKTPTSRHARGKKASFSRGSAYTSYQSNPSQSPYE